VWRFNYEGWGASKNGYNGPFEMGATFNDGIIADFITAGTLNAANVKVINLIANNIVSGILKSTDGKTYFDLNNGSVVANSQYGKVELFEGRFNIYNSSGILKLNASPFSYANTGEKGVIVSIYSDYGDRLAFFSVSSDDLILSLPTKTGDGDYALFGLKPSWNFSETLGDYYIGARSD
jgi:hypothetical protein